MNAICKKSGCGNECIEGHKFCSKECAPLSHLTDKDPVPFGKKGLLEVDKNGNPFEKKVSKLKEVNIPEKALLRD